MSATTQTPTAASDTTTARTSTGDGARRRNLLPTLLLLALLLYFLVPLYWLIVASTKTNADLFGTFGLWFGDDLNVVQNLRDLFAFEGGIFARWLFNTFWYSTASAVGASLLAAAGGYAFAKFRFPGRELLFALILGAIMIPTTALAIPTFLLVSRIGLVDTPWAVILPSMVNPFGLYLMRVYADGAVPTELIEAGRVDGAGEFRIFRTLAFPLMTPGFVTVLLFSFVATWNNYFLPLVVLSTRELLPVTVGLAAMNAQATAGGGARVLFTVVLMGALVTITPLIAAFFMLQRYWQGGLSVGSVK